MLKDKTLTVFVIDDEQLVRELLIGMINWDAIGLRVIGDSGSAMESLELIENETPDIVFVDINMPFINGLQLSELLHQRYPYMKIIILTGYQNYDYVRRGLRIGISDYLTKPISAEEVTASLIRVKKEITDWYQLQNEMDRLKTLCAENQSSERERVLRNLIYSPDASAFSPDELEYLGIRMDYDDFQIVLIELSVKDWPGERTEYRYMAFLHCMDACRNYLSRRTDCFVFPDVSNRITVLFHSGENIIPCCRQMKSYLDALLKYPVSIGVGKHGSGLPFIHQSYCQASDALRYKGTYEGCDVICFSDIEMHSISGSKRLFDSESFSFWIESGQKESAINYMHHLLNPWNHSSPSHEDAFQTGLSIISCLRDICESTGVALSELSGDEKAPYRKMLDLAGVSDIEIYLRGMVESLIEKRNLIRQTASSDTVNEIIRYINENITDYTLSLTGVADHFQMNPSYISRLFKQQINENFSKYILKIRIDRAIGIIRGGNRKVNQVAEMVGFIDPHYFGVCFKKQKGMSVTEFIRENCPHQ